MPRGFVRYSVRKFAGGAGPSAADTCPRTRRIAAMKAPRRRPSNRVMTNLPWQDAEKHLNVCHPKPFAVILSEAKNPSVSLRVNSAKDLSHFFFSTQYGDASLRSA